MKSLMVINVILLVGACGTIPTVESVLGVYERVNYDGDTERMKLFDDCVIEWYKNGKRDGENTKWKIVDGEIYVEDNEGNAELA